MRLNIQSGRLIIWTVAIAALAAPAEANRIENACLTSERATGDAVLCKCIQSAADRSLTANDQTLAASFFKDPHRAQVIRQSNRRSHEAFWERYETFSKIAESRCSR